MPQPTRPAARRRALRGGRPSSSSSPAALPIRRYNGLRAIAHQAVGDVEIRVQAPRRLTPLQAAGKLGNIEGAPESIEYCRPESASAQDHGRAPLVAGAGIVQTLGDLAALIDYARGLRLQGAPAAA